MSKQSPAPFSTGGCQCGAIRYTLRAKPKSTICHCRMCQKAVGGPFAAIAMVARSDLTWTGAAPAWFESSSVARRGFCAKCGTPLTYETLGLDGDNIEVTIGSLDRPDLAVPVEQFGVESRMPWFETLAALPASRTCGKFDGLVSYQHPDRDA